MTMTAIREQIIRETILPGLRDGTYHSLLPRHKVYLASYSDVDGSRFARLFRETWKRIPLWARRGILAHWRAPNETADAFPGIRPFIELTTGWSGRKEARATKGMRRLQGDWGVCKGLGNKVLFWEPIVNAIPDNLVCDLIAHELAHVHQWATGYLVDTNDDPLDTEMDADWRMEQWGFSATDMDEWGLANGVSRVIQCESVQDPAFKRYIGRLLKNGR